MPSSKAGVPPPPDRRESADLWAPSDDHGYLFDTGDVCGQAPSMDALDHEVIADVYWAFAGYGRPATFLGCPCGGCWGSMAYEVDEVVVPSPGGDRPLRELAPEEVENLIATVPGTSGDVDLFKHYLPRLLELVAEGRLTSDWAGADRVVETLEAEDPDGEVRWKQWPEPESRAVGRFLDRFITPEWRADWLDDELD